MKMKKHIYTLLLAATAMFCSCESRLDIVPKGSTTLSTVDELESLINQRWRIYDNDLDYSTLVGTTFPKYKNYKSYGQVKNSLQYAYMFGDESVDRINLTDEDYRYQEPYKHINYINIMLSKLPEANGSDAKRKQLMAEGRVLRAWFHFIVVNFFAQPYDEAKAAELGGIAYVDNTNSGEQKTKLSLKESYDRILGDCTDEIIADLKPSLANDPCRFEQDFGYAVRAMALFQMKDYEGALKYANLALKANPFIEDRSGIVSSASWDCPFESPDNYLFINSNSVLNSCTLGWFALPKETCDLYEDGDYVRYYSSDDPFNPHWLSFDAGETYNYGAPGSMLYSGSGARVNVYGINSEMMYYLAGECLIRLGQVEEGLGKIDLVRAKRIHPDNFVAFKGQTTDRKAAMDLLWKAKKIEFLISPVLYYDVKRRNTEPEYRVEIKHVVPEYGEYTIPYDSPLWVTPFPMSATNYNSSLTQNY